MGQMKTILIDGHRTMVTESPRGIFTWGYDINNRLCRVGHINVKLSQMSTDFIIRTLGHRFQLIK
jgi:hypothetical protein